MRLEPAWQRKCLIHLSLLMEVLPSGGHAGLRGSFLMLLWIAGDKKDQLEEGTVLVQAVLVRHQWWRLQA